MSISNHVWNLWNQDFIRSTILLSCVFSWAGSRGSQRKTKEPPLLQQCVMTPPPLASLTSPSVCPTRSQRRSTKSLLSSLRPQHSGQICPLTNRRAPHLRLYSQLSACQQRRHMVQSIWRSQKTRKMTVTELQLRRLNVKLCPTALSWQKNHNHGISLVLQLSLRFQVPLPCTHVFLHWRRVLWCSSMCKLWKMWQRDLQCWRFLSRNLLPRVWSLWSLWLEFPGASFTQKYPRQLQKFRYCPIPK